MWDKSISLGNILTMLAMIASVFMGYGRLDTRVSLIEESQKTADKNSANDAVTKAQQQLEVRQDLREIRQRIDSLTDSISRSSYTKKN